MDWLGKIIRYLTERSIVTRRWKQCVLTLAAIIVFGTTYALILPAITIDKKSADSAPGMYMEGETGNQVKKGESILHTAPADNTYEVTVDYSSAAGLADAQSIEVEKIGSNDPVYSEYRKKLTSQLESGKLTALEIFSLTFRDENGQPVAFRGNAKVTITYNKALKAGKDSEIRAFSGLMPENAIWSGVRADRNDDSVKSISYQINKEGITGIAVISNAVASEADTEEKAAEASETVPENVEKAEEKTDAKPETETADEAVTSADSSAQDDTDKKADDKEDHTLTASDDNCKVILTYDKESGIPAEGATLKVSELSEGSKDYKAYISKAESCIGKNKEIRHAKLYDITILVDGKEFEPKAPVQVRVEAKDMPAVKNTEISMVHIPDKGKGKAKVLDDKDVDLEKKKGLVKSVDFTADTFSVYGVVYTVEFQETVLTAKGDKYEITVSCDENAKIPSDTKLVVKEISEDDKDYSDLCENAAEVLKENNEIKTKPVPLSISLVSDGKEIEPAEGSKVKVEVKLVKSAMNGAFTDENAALLINDEPIEEKYGEVEQALQVVHQKQDGEVETVDTKDTVNEEKITSSFATESFSDWLLFLDETVENITIGKNDTLTLRPYSKWVWKSTEEEEQYANYEWRVPTNSSVINFGNIRYKYDEQLREGYYYYHAAPSNTGEFDIQLVDGNTVKHTIHVTVVDDVQDTPPAIPPENTADIKVNLFDYDVPRKNNQANTFDFTKSGSLDESNNKADAYPNTGYNTSVNTGSDLKFLGWGAGNTNNEWFTINNYSQDVANQGILNPRLSGGYPQLGKSDNGQDREQPSLKYLFDTTSRTNSVYAFPDVNGLFQRDTEGYYYYNSNSNYAYYDPVADNKQITLYEHTYSQFTNKSGGANAKPIGFFPFHQYDSYLRQEDGMNHNKNLNHHFGMSMTVDFEIPSDGLDDNGNPIVFEFSGDDDMWVFVDDNLVLDVGGIHQPVTGKINFSADKVSVFGEDDTSITQQFVDAGSPKSWEIGDGKPHTMKIFYLERGGCDSNLSVKFNTPIRYGKGKLSLVKREKNKTTPLKDAKFGIWNNAKCQGDPIAQYTTDENGQINFGEFVLKSATDTLYLKEIEQPDGFIRDTEIYQVKPRLDNDGVAVKDSDGYIILDVLDKDGHALTKTDNDSVVFPNTKIEKINIPAKKEWVGGSGGNAEVTLTIKRFKLIDKVKGFMVVKELWNEPDDYAFDAVYKITYPDGTQKFVNYSEFNNGIYGIEDAVPGDYLIEEDVRSTAPNGYHMEHTEQSLNITLEEDGTALANFKTTFVRDMGQLFIKENVTVQFGNAAEIDYSGVRYAVLDASGKKVTSITHAQAVKGISLNLPVGTYSVKAASVPETPYNYDRTEQYVVSDSHSQNGTVLHNIIVTKDNQTNVNFNTKYVKLNNAQNCKWRIKDRYNNQNYANGNVDYPVGTKLKMTFQVPQSQAFNTDYTVSYNGQTLTSSVSSVQNNYEFAVEFTVVNNAELVFNINGREDWYHNKHVDVAGPRFEVLAHAPSASASNVPSASTNGRLLSTKRLTANTPLFRTAQNEAKHPEAPVGKKYVKDSEWSETITLNSGNNWDDTLQDLPATDDEGNKYYYYVDSVNETGVPDGTICNIDLDGEDLYLIGQDLHSDGTLSVTNTLTGSLKITKEVTVNQDAVTDHTKACPADGEYTFTITKDGTPIAESPVTITITNGEMKSEEVDNLLPGTYRVTEVEPTNGAELDKINGSDATQSYFDIVVEAGKIGTDAPNVTFTNNIVDTEIKVIKVKKDTEIPVPGAKFKLTRVDNNGNDITTPGEAYSFEDEVDPETGELEFTGLRKGRYKLEETFVPEGYIKNEQFYFITIGKDGSGALDTSIPHEMISPESGNEYTVENEPGAELPHAGGIGTTRFILFGSLIMMFAAAGMLLMRKREEVNR